jgi:hypothetical protein
MKVVPRPPPSALAELASWFGQDFELIFPDLDVVGVARIHFRQLTAAKAVVLRGELLEFLRKHSEQPPGVLTRLWVKQGVQYWPRGLDTRATLKMFLDILDERPASAV